jgi:signal-transduction protein with cAMP-binding, CBS, and nucleotidyltransferase domain
MNWKNIGQWIISLIINRSNLDYLRKFPILNGFSTHELFLFSQIIQERHFKEGEIIYQEQFPLAVVYLISKGAIELTENYQSSSVPTVLHKHQFLGVVDMYNENRRQGEAIAIKDSTLLAVSHLDFSSFIKTNPSTGVKLLNNICQALSHYIFQQTKPIEE